MAAIFMLFQDLSPMMGSTVQMVSGVTLSSNAPADTGFIG